MLWFFLFFIWIWLLIMVFADIFRDHTMGGFGQGGVDHLRDHRPVPRSVRVPDRARRLDGASAAAQQQKADQQFKQYVQSVGREAGAPPTNSRGSPTSRARA